MSSKQKDGDKKPVAIITGSSGFIGSHLTKFLQQKGYSVIGIDCREPEFAFAKPDIFHQADLRDPQLATKYINDASEVYMLAADMGGVGYINTVNAAIIRNNSLINLNTLQAAVDNNVKKVFFASSACVYPEFKQDELDSAGLKESDAVPAQPDTPYGWEKLFTEQACSSYATDHGLQIRIARFHNIFGPYGTFEGGREKSPAALCRKVAQANDAGSIEIWGDGEQQRSYCYVDDCVQGIWQLMQSEINRPINIGSDRMVSINQMVEIISKHARKSIDLKHDLSKPQGVRSRNADITLAKDVLKWAPKISLEEGLGKTYEWIAQELARR